MSMEQFEAFAEEHGIEIQAQSVSNRPDADEDAWSKESLHFFVTLTRPDRTPEFKPNRPPIVVWSGFYSVGSAHPEMWAKANKGKVGFRVHDALRKLKLENPRSLYAEGARKEIREAYRKAAPLKVADILYSLQMDSHDWESTFEDWCANLGYDDDSRKAYRIFEACQNTAKTLLRSLGRENFDKFLDLQEV